MVEEAKDLTGHLLTEIGRIHDSQDRIIDKLSEQGETLIRNTVTLEEHVKRTNILQKKVTNVESEVDDIKVHINKINWIVGILKPTKDKIKWLIVLASILGGSYGGYQLSVDDTISKTVEVIEKVIQ